MIHALPGMTINYHLATFYIQNSRYLLSTLLLGFSIPLRLRRNHLKLSSYSFVSSMAQLKHTGIPVHSLPKSFYPNSCIDTLSSGTLLNPQHSFFPVYIRVIDKPKPPNIGCVALKSETFSTMKTNNKMALNVSTSFRSTCQSLIRLAQRAL